MSLLDFALGPELIRNTLAVYPTNDKAAADYLCIPVEKVRQLRLRQPVERREVRHARRADENNAPIVSKPAQASRSRARKRARLYVARNDPRTIIAELDAIGRTRALTDEESYRLEMAIARVG